MKLIAIVLILILSLGSTKVFGCTCSSATAEELVDGAKHIFVAHVTSAKAVPSIVDEEEVYFRVLAQFDTIETLKGNPSFLDQLEGGLGMGDCSLPIIVGHHLYVQTDDSGGISICAGSRAAFPWDEEWDEFLQGIRNYLEDGTPIPSFDFEEWEY